MYKLRKFHMLVKLEISECNTMNTDYNRIIIIEAFIKHRIPGKTTCPKALQYRGSYKK